MRPEIERDHDIQDQKPRLALLGEFSAGKSTLANALLGRASSPVRVTATQVPPIWYSAGSCDPVLVEMDGTETTITPEEVASVPVEGTRAVKVFLESDILEAVDLIDMPGSSDPNMSADIWDALLPLADMVIWCTPAAQAWRQSEAAIWDMVPERLHRRSLLLLTRIDTVRTEEDRARLIARVTRETDGLFREVLPVSPLQAIEADGGADGLRASGLTDVIDALEGIMDDVLNPEVPSAADLAAELRKTRSRTGPSYLKEVPQEDPPEVATTAPPASDGAAMPSGIIPRRIRPAGDAGRSRRPRSRESLI